ncbi:DUF3145 family protein [Rhodoluna sp.]|uniref:DUF3145 family protein n=1 Tax=Rhodoluna sp. TaxID=1969481 RepID=UPI0025EAB0BF|nr:DUF3145 family protein [Rhodoluna sp.]
MVFIHSAPRALMAHLEWSIASVLDTEVRLQWADQPIAPKSARTEFLWSGHETAGVELAAILASWQKVRFEVNQQSSEAQEGSRWVYTPSLGMFYSPVDSAGNILASELRIRSAIDAAGTNLLDLQRGLRAVLGQAWDDELEGYRKAELEKPQVELRRIS